MKTVADALELARFPPDSRPLNAEMVDVLRPYRRWEAPLPAVRRKDGKARDPETEPHFVFTASTFALFAGDVMDPRLEVWAGAPGGATEPEHVAVEIVGCAVSKMGTSSYLPVGSLPINDRGESGDLAAGDRIYAVKVDPRSFDTLRGFRGLVRVEVEFRIPGLEDTTHGVLSFQLAQSPPARFSERVTESLDASGLLLRVGLEVEEAGYYYIQGNLFDAKGTPIGFAVHRETYERGAREAPLQFFGLLFHEAKTPGPYVLRTVIGYRLPADGERERVDMTPMKTEHRTRAYKLADFSTKEYESEEKARRIEALTDLANSNADKHKESEASPESSGAAPPASAAPSKP
jgi:hypothetical protein